MRPRFNNQPQFQFQALPTLKITECYYGKYDRIDAILAGHPELVDLIHHDIAEPLDCEKAPDATGEDCYKCSSETVLRIVICQIIEGCSLREIVVRIGDGDFLRRFVRVYNDPMLDYSTFCRLRNRVKPETWKQINKTLARTAVDQGHISGDRTRLDTPRNSPRTKATTAAASNLQPCAKRSTSWPSTRRANAPKKRNNASPIPFSGTPNAFAPVSRVLEHFPFLCSEPRASARAVSRRSMRREGRRTRHTKTGNALFHISRECSVWPAAMSKGGRTMRPPSERPSSFTTS
jgi:hypothetical protein